MTSSSSVPPSRTEDSASLLPGTLVGDRYVIEEKVGRGGMGAVYRAEHRMMGRTVALKVLHRELTALPDRVSRFEREAVASGRIQHPNVVAASDFGRLEDGSFYLVLDFVEGVTLTSALSTSKPFPVARSLHIIRQVLEALEVAHHHGIVHRDLKPDNVMLVEHHGDPDFVKVLDFGVAKLQQEPSTGEAEILTEAGTILGTPEYMAPEQAAGREIDERADLYAVGVILYEMLTGAPPFQSESILGVLTAQLTAPLPSLPTTLPSRLVAIVQKSLAKDANQRFQSARLLLDALEGNIGVKSLLPLALARLGRKLWLTSLAVALAVPALVLLLRNCSSSDALDVEPSWPSTSALHSAARRGEAPALAELAKVPETARPLEAWQALVVGNAENLPSSDWLHFLGRALQLQPQLAEDLPVQRALLVRAQHSETQRLALRLLGQRMGSAGADLLYAWSHAGQEVYATVVGKELMAGAEQQLEEAALRHASPALLVALGLESAESCSQRLAQLPDALRYGDARSVPVLKRFLSRTGCGERGRRDCHPCLRDRSLVRRALRSAQSNPAPQLPSLDKGRTP